MTDIGSTIQRLREAKGYTQDQLAEKLFVSRQTVSNYERNKSQPSLEMLEMIADIFDMDTASFLTAPRDKKAEVKHLAIQGGVCLVLLVSYILLHQLALIRKDECYDSRLLYWVNILLRPGLWGWLGYFSTGVIVTATSFPFKNKRWHRFIYPITIVVGISYCIIMFPFLFSWDTSRNWSHVAYWILGATWHHGFPGAYLAAAFLLGAAWFICHSGDDLKQTDADAMNPVLQANSKKK